MFDTRRVNANSISAIAGSMTSGIKGIIPAVSLRQQAIAAGRIPSKVCTKKFRGAASKGPCGCGSKKSFYVVKRSI